MVGNPCASWVAAAIPHEKGLYTLNLPDNPRTTCFATANIVPRVSWLLVAIPGYLAWAFLARLLVRGPLTDDVNGGIFWLFTRLYARVVHNLRIEGRAAIPRSLADGSPPGPIIVLANHTAGVDPVLVQACVPWFIRWVMAEDMRLPQLEWLWKWIRIIFVSRTSRDSLGTRQAIRHLHAGGAIGIFPEGGLERPAAHIMPFQAGVGLLIKRSGARVLPVIVDGTPQVDPAWSSLWRASRSRLRFKPLLDYSKTTMSPAEIADDLRRRYIEWTGWGANDEPAEIEAGGAGKSRQVKKAA